MVLKIITICHKGPWKRHAWEGRCLESWAGRTLRLDSKRAIAWCMRSSNQSARRQETLGDIWQIASQVATVREVASHMAYTVVYILVILVFASQSCLWDWHISTLNRSNRNREARKAQPGRSHSMQLPDHHSRQREMPKVLHPPPVASVPGLLVFGNWKRGTLESLKKDIFRYVLAS